jgi:hypothetical protein
VLLLLMIDAALFIGPLLLFAPKLWQCRVSGLDTYMDFAARYVNGFDKKWIGPKGGTGEQLLGTADVQALADLSTSVNLVSNMRLIPATTRLAWILAAAALVPMLPLMLLKYPVAELARDLFGILFKV